MTIKKSKSDKKRSRVKECNVDMKEIFVDDIPVGFVILNDDGLVERSELYIDDIMGSRYDTELIYEFTKKLLEYEWVENEGDDEIEIYLEK